MKREESFIIIPERYICDMQEPFIIEKNENGIFINGVRCKYVQNINIYTEGNKNVIEVNRLFKQDDLEKINQELK